MKVRLSLLAASAALSPLLCLLGTSVAAFTEIVWMVAPNVGLITEMADA